MRLKRVVLENNQYGSGLKMIDINNLGQVVALFGPNGAGKTRLLKCVQKYVDESEQAIGEVGKSRENELRHHAQDYANQLLNLEDQRVKSKSLGVSMGISKVELDEKYEQKKKNKKNVEDSLGIHLKLKERVSNSFYELPKKKPILVKLSFPINQLQEVNSYTQDALDGSMILVSNWKSSVKFAKGVIPFLHQLSRAGFSAHNPNVKEENLAPWLQLYEEAKRIIKLLMRMEYGYVAKGVDGVPGLNGRPIRMNELSEGQKMLLLYTACLLKGMLGQYEKGRPETVEGAIVLIDEPEVHLHPAAVIQLVDSMRQVVGETGQIWLGTHAVCLLPHLKNGEIWTVYDGDVSLAGIDKAHKAVELLVGSSDDVNKLQSFLEEPAKWAAAHFSAECLKPPGKVEFKPGDPQMFQISNVIDKRMGKSDHVCILDCGAARGRLAIMLREIFTEEQQKLINYLPVEPDASCHPEIKDAAAEMLSDCGVLLSVEGIPIEYMGKIHIAVLCNVLHEIRPTKWYHELDLILKSMVKEGSILICEDQFMPVGELPHELGFLVLGAQEIQTLFGLKVQPKVRMSQDNKYKDRLLCIEIPVASSNVTKESVKNAVTNLRGRLDGLIQKMRGSRVRAQAKDGRQYAFYSQMFVNCDFALKELG